VRLDLLDRLLRLRSRVGEHLVGLPPHGLGLGLRLPDDPLGHPARIGQDLVGLAVRGGDVLLRRPLGEGQHLQGLLDVAAGCASSGPGGPGGGACMPGSAVTRASSGSGSRCCPLVRAFIQPSVKGGPP
jgi:hypothetical protein